jgi:uncharacterized protein (DUF1015 family)
VPSDEKVLAFFPGKTIYIADGHHRFRTACAYRDEMRAKEGPSDTPRPWDYALMGFVAFEDEGLSIYAAHRVVKPYPGFDFEVFRRCLAVWFEVTPVKEGDLAELVMNTPGDGVFGLSVRNWGKHLLRFKGKREVFLGKDHGETWRALDVALVHRGIFEKVLGMTENAEYGYEKNVKEALAQVDRGQALMTVVLKPTRAEQIRACAEAGESMPQKSTYFFPKLPTGSVLYPLY